MNPALGLARRLAANARRLVRRGAARLSLPRGRYWVVVRVPSPLTDLRPPALPFGREAPPLGLLELLEVLERAGEDPQVAGVLLRLQGSPGGFGKLQALRRVVKSLRERGTPVAVYADELATETYLLASAANRIWLPPAGSLYLLGLRSEGWFLKDFLTRWGVDPQVVRIGGFKTAAEALTRQGMSPEQREQVGALLDDLYEELIAGIADGRELTPDTVRERIDAGPYGGRSAVNAGLIDACLYPDELEEALVEISSEPRPELVKGRVPRVEAAAYYALRASDRGWRPLLRDLPRIAYVVGDGVIHRGRGLRGIAADSYRQHLERVREDPGVCGVVLRIESPGGDGVASDLLWRQLMVTRKEKPVVATMGDVAASGGYYLAAAADTVFAEAGTVTGSIGVVGGKLNLGGLYERLGIAREGIERGARAGLLSESRAFTADERAAVGGVMRDLYETFLDRVAEGRGLERGAVEKVAQGRVWSGAAAHRLGLVDAIGGPLEALAEVRRRAGLAPDAPVLVEVHPRVPRFPGLRTLIGLMVGLRR